MMISIGFFTYKSLQTATNQSVYAVEPCTTPSPSPSSTPTATPTSTPSPTPTPTATPLVQNVYLTEFMACPASGNEWLELYNSNPTPLTVTNWQIIDETGNKKYLNGTIPANEFLKFEWTGSLLNNTGDSFTVVTNNGQTIGTASYDSCSTGVSFVYESGEWVGALESPNEETTLSAASLPNSTAAALLRTTKTESASNSDMFSGNTPAIAASTIRPSPPPYALPTLTPNEPISNQPALTLPQSDHSFWPAISVIIGGLFQLLPSSVAFYGNTKKYFD